ncbi:hypothetical protein HK097_005581, partial [Rhizophlyctis rosea]
AGRGVEGVSRWIWVAKWKCFVVGTVGLELKTLDFNFAELTSTSSVKPVLSLEFNEADEELIVGGVGNIRVWAFKKVAESSRMLYHFSGPRLVMQDLDGDDWVCQTIYQPAWNKLYAAVNNSVMIYDYETGQRTETLREIHDLSITSMVFHHEMEYLVTASRDSTIKVWNRHSHLLHSLHSHAQSVTALCLLPSPSLPAAASTPSTPSRASTRQSRGAPPLMLSCSLDGTIRMWNLETGHCMYRLETSSECLGMGWMKRDTFYHFERGGVWVWGLNRFWSCFAYFRSSVTHIRRIESPHTPARILTVTEDGSIRLLSPVTGTVLATGFPVISDIGVVDVEYDIAQASKEKITCLTSITLTRFIEPQPGQMKPYPSILALLGGTDSGQIAVVDVRTGGKREMVVQAHTAEITAVTCDTRLMKVFSAGKDQSIKIWTISLPSTPPSNPLQVLTNLTPSAAQQWSKSKAMPSIQLDLLMTVQVEGDVPVQRMW